MTKFLRTVPRLNILVLTLAALAGPASATITYTSCTSGCGSTSGSYAIWQTASGSAGLSFSMSPATFAPGGNLASGVYTDPSGTVLTGYSGATIDTLMSVAGSSLVEGNNGSGTGIQIQLPANTYAFAMNFTTFAGSSFSTFAEELGDHNVLNSNYNTNVASGGSVQFFGVISSTPLTEVFIGPIGNGPRLVINDFELGESSPSSPTPEVSTIAMIGGGLVLLGILRRRQVHKPDRSLT